MGRRGCRRRWINEGQILVLIILLALFSVLMIHTLQDRGEKNAQNKKTISDREFRAEFFSEEMWKQEENMPESCKKYLKQVKKEAKYFPVPMSELDKSLETSYINGWMSERTYNGKRGHEGTDIMALKNQRGLYPVISISDGVVSNMGWLDKGGYRIGITSDSGTYYYYAHLDSYANIREGDQIKAGQFLGYMGDSGYGEEGTVGKFDVHLHLGIYFYEDGKEISVNPYYLLKSLENNKLKYQYS